MITEKPKHAGRKAVPKEEKKIGYKVYLTQEQQDEIEFFGVGSSFSERCANLISLELERQKEVAQDTVRVIDLFAGLGGIRLGFEQGLKKQGLHTKCVFTSEIKKYAIKAYQNQFGNEKIYGDITQIDTRDIPDFDVLLAGFPCQPFSSAGKGLGFSDTRGTLFFEIERIINEKNRAGKYVKAFLLENVEGLVNHDKGNTLKVIISKLKKLGYNVNWKVLDSQHFGLAQSRKRIYIVGTLKQMIDLDKFNMSTATFGDIMEHGLPTLRSKFTKCLLSNFSAEEILGKSIKDKRGGAENIHSWDIDLKGKTTRDQRELLNLLLKERRKKKWAEEIGIKWMDGMPLTAEQIKTFYYKKDLQIMLDDLVKKGYLTFEHPKALVEGERKPDFTKPKGYNIVAGKLSFEFSKILDPNDLVPTLVAMDVSKLGVVDGQGIRRLTIREGQKLCGYNPDTYDLSILKESEAFDLLGNTVCVPVISAIAEKLAVIIKEI
ncbi:MAG: DNA (cytosine-5-)-methyltransferase [Paenibacillaceae bacterium]|nr:DNA (cytosine-5-)-methyltransferase [Paenibacillaceae bacterium]